MSVEAQSQVVFETEFTRVSCHELRCDLLTLEVILSLKVCFCEEESDLKVFGEPVVSGLVQINCKLTIFISHEQVGMVEHGMTHKFVISLTVANHLEDLLGLCDLVVLTEYIGDTE